jgi:hypothetical protein
MTIDRYPRRVDRARTPAEADAQSPPADRLDLIYRLWLTLNWARTGQLAVVLLCCGLLLAMVIGGLVLMAPSLNAAA